MVFMPPIVVTYGIALAQRFVTVVIPAAQILLPPFFDPTNSGPGVPLIPNVGPLAVHQQIIITKQMSYTTPGTAWGTSISVNNSYLDPATASSADVARNSIDTALSADLSTTSPYVVTVSPGKNESWSLPSLGDSVVIWTTDDASSGGVGDRTLRLRFEYNILTPGLLIT